MSYTPKKARDNPLRDEDGNRVSAITSLPVNNRSTAEKPELWIVEHPTRNSTEDGSMWFLIRATDAHNSSLDRDDVHLSVNLRYDWENSDQGTWHPSRRTTALKEGDLVVPSMGTDAGYWEVSALLPDDMAVQGPVTVTLMGGGDLHGPQQRQLGLHPHRLQPLLGVAIGPHELAAVELSGQRVIEDAHPEVLFPPEPHSALYPARQAQHAVVDRGEPVKLDVIPLKVLIDRCIALWRWSGLSMQPSIARRTNCSGVVGWT